jgi:ATP-dependent DNA helicase RecG
MDYVEEKGFGMKTFKSLNKQYGLPIPKYSFKVPFLTLTFPRTSDAVKDVMDKDAIDELSTDELKNFEIFREKKPVSKSEFADFADLTTRTAERYLKRYVDFNLIKVVGGGKYTKYVLNE